MHSITWCFLVTWFFLVWEMLVDGFPVCFSYTFQDQKVSVSCVTLSFIHSNLLQRLEESCPRCPRCFIQCQYHTFERKSRRGLLRATPRKMSPTRKRPPFAIRLLRPSSILAPRVQGTSRRVHCFTFTQQCPEM